MWINVAPTKFAASAKFSKAVPFTANAKSSFTSHASTFVNAAQLII